MKSNFALSITVTSLMLANLSFADTVKPATNTTARVSEPKSAEILVYQKLKTIVLPEVTFRPPATLVDAIDFLRQASRDNDDAQIPEERRGVNVILNLPPTASATPAAVPAIPAMSVRSISLYDALKLVCDVTGMKFRITGNIVMVVPRTDSDAQAPARLKTRQK